MTRIIAGIARGRRLDVPESETRPTSDRAREGVFSAISARMDLSEARVVDLFAGSGALGLEAASRGAGYVVLVDRDARAAEVMRGNADVLSDSQAHIEVLQEEADKALARFQEPFDLIIADPPYAVSTEEIAHLLELLPRISKPGTMVVIERHRDDPAAAWPEEFRPTTQKLKRRTYGIARMDMAVYAPETNQGE